MNWLEKKLNLMFPIGFEARGKYLVRSLDDYKIRFLTKEEEQEIARRENEKS